MPMYNLIKHSGNHSKISGSLWRYYRDEPALNNNGAVENLPGSSDSFKFKVKITETTPDDGNTKDVKIAVPLKYFLKYH